MWRIFRAPLEAWVQFVMRGLVVRSPMFSAWVFKKNNSGIAELLCIRVFTASPQEDVSMAGAYGAKTRFAPLPGHEGEVCQLNWKTG
jgi:hypothetical protein